MNQNLITFRSVTYAQRGERSLTRRGIGCTVMRTPKSVSYTHLDVYKRQVQTFPLVISSLIYGDMPPWNQLMAGAIMACIPIIIIYMLASSSLVGGATAGGVKQ